MPRRKLTGSRASLRPPALCRFPACVLVFAACLEPQLARADFSGARADLTALPADRSPERVEPVAAAELRSVESVKPTSVESVKPTPTDSLELRLSYRAPHDCPSSGAFLAALQQHVTVGGSGAIDADVSIARTTPSEFELVLRLRVGGTSSESVTRSGSCMALVQLAALNASMARTMTRPDANVLLSPAPPPEVEPRLQPTLPLASAQVDDDAQGTTTEPGAAARQLRPFVTGDVRTQSGMLPRPAWGQGLSLGVRRGAASLRLSATFWQEQRRGFAPENVSGVSLDFEQRSLALAPCAGHAVSRLLRLDACALLAAHQVGTNGGSSRTIAAVGAVAIATLSPWSGLRVELEGGLSATLNQPMFGVQADPFLYQPEVLQPGARVALGWEFGGGT